MDGFLIKIKNEGFAREILVNHLRSREDVNISLFIQRSWLEKHFSVTIKFRSSINCEYYVTFTLKGLSTN